VEAIDDAIDAVESLVADGTLNKGQGNSLIAKLETARKQLLRGKLTPTVPVLNAFLNEVNALVQSARLTPAQAFPLLYAATAAIELIESEG
jgi:hypothetical protein